MYRNYLSFTAEEDIDLPISFTVPAKSLWTSDNMTNDELTITVDNNYRYEIPDKSPDVITNAFGDTLEVYMPPQDNVRGGTNLHPDDQLIVYIAPSIENYDDREAIKNKLKTLMAPVDDQAQYAVSSTRIDINGQQVEATGFVIQLSKTVELGAEGLTLGTMGKMMFIELWPWRTGRRIKFLWIRTWC